MLYLLEVICGNVLGTLIGFLINYGIILGFIYLIFRKKINILFEFIQSLTKHYNAQSRKENT